MNIRSLLSFGLVAGLAVALTLFKVPLASSQGVSLVAAQISGQLPTAEPESPVWQQATAVDVPMSAQTIVRPMLPESRIKSVTARALHNGTHIAILVEWADETRDESMVRAQDFRDAVAVQFPLVEGQPFFCMGQQGGNVNLWHWKADWQADIAARQDMETAYPNLYVDLYPFADPAAGLAAGPSTYVDLSYLPALAAGNLFASATRPSPVEDLIAGGFGSLTAQPADGQNVQGYGVWDQGKWRVIFSRELTSREADDVNFQPGKVYALAFATWDGANDERNGQKSTSQWVSLQIAGPAPQPAQPGPGPAPIDWLGLGFVVAPMALVALIILGLLAGAVALSLLARMIPRK